MGFRKYICHIVTAVKLRHRIIISNGSFSSNHCEGDGILGLDAPIISTNLQIDGIFVNVVFFGKY